MFGVTIRFSDLTLSRKELEKCARKIVRVSSKRGMRYTTEGGYPVVIEERCRQTTTMDTSSRTLYTGIYPYFEERRTYTTDGRLLQAQAIELKPHMDRGGSMVPGPSYQFLPRSGLPFLGRQIRCNR